MNNIYRFLSTAFVGVAIAAMTVTPRLSAQTAGDVSVAQGGSRCTRLTYPSFKEAAAYRKKAAERVKAPMPGEPGTRCTRMWGKHAPKVKVIPNASPVVALNASLEGVFFGLGRNDHIYLSAGGTMMPLVAVANDPDGDSIFYTWTATGGRITGNGPNVAWDTAGTPRGTYHLTVEADDGCGCVSFHSVSIPVR